MYALNTNIKEFKAKIAAGEHPHAGRPSDSPYMDCSNPKVDFNGDHREDYDAEKALDTVWDVLVGRIPYYGEESAWGKYSDVDAILEKSINYDNASSEELLERYNFEIDGMVLDGHVAEWAGFNYITREQSHRGRLTLDHFSWQNNSFMDQYNVGFLRSGGHASPTFIESGVTSGWLAHRAAPKDTLNVVAEYGGCDCSQPEHPMNMGYMHLRKGAIATVGASRSIAGVRGHGGFVKPQAFHNIRISPLKRGISIGQAHWQGLTGGQRMPNGGAQMWTLYGDPSIVPFPQKLNPKRNHALRPVHALEHHEPITVSSAKLHSQEYDIQNLSGKDLKWSVSKNIDWVDFSGKTEGLLKAGEIATVKINFNKKSRELPKGMNRVILKFTIGDKTEYRNFEYIRYVPEMTHNFEFADKDGGVFKGNRDGKFPIFDRFCSDNFVNRTFSFEITPHGKLRGNSTIAAGPEFRMFIHGDQIIQLDWKPYGYGEQAWNLRFNNVSNGQNSLSLKSRIPLIANQANRISISTDFITDKAILFVNGQKQAECSMNNYLFLPWKTDLGHGLNASIDNFRMVTKATDTNEAYANYSKGMPVMSPLPEYMAKSVNRIPKLTWTNLNSKANSFKVYLGKSEGTLSLIGESKQNEFKIQRALDAEKEYFWRVDTITDKGTRSGYVWTFKTGKTISREVIPYPLFASSDKWQSKWPKAGREANGIIAFKGYGHNISQKLNKEKLIKGGYKLTFFARSGEQKPTRPMIFTLFGKNENGEQIEFLSKTIELNELRKGKVEAFFELSESLTNKQEVFCKIQLPGTNGSRCPYWVFASGLSLYNNYDLSSLPNKAPRFKNKTITLPNMPAKDNSYAFTFLNEVEDETPKKLTFRKLEGPDWITVQASGRLFSYYGAPMSAIGKHRLKVEVVDEEGLTDVIHTTLEVKIPGEMVLGSTEAVLAQGKEIRLTGNLITHITHNEATASWNFKPAVSGSYEVYLFAGTPDENIGRVSINGKDKDFIIKKTGGYRNIRQHKVGEFELTKGEQTRLTLGVVKKVDGLCDASHFLLVPKVN